MRRTTLIRRAAAAGSAFALVLAVSSCASGGKDQAAEPTPASDASSSSAASDDPGTDQSETTGSEDGADVRDEFLKRLESGISGATTARVNMRLESGGSGFAAKGQIDYTTDPPSMSMSMSMAELGNQKMEMRLVDGVMYMNMGALSGNKFVAFDLSDPNSPLGDTQELRDSMDPLKSLEGFDKGLEKVVLVGQDTIDGDPVDHYRLTVDTKAMAPEMQGQTADLPRKLDYDLWMDAQDLMRKMTMDVPGSTVTMTMSDWGKPVSIKKPPAGQIADLSSLGGAA